jgi:hypothetical protein
MKKKCYYCGKKTKRVKINIKLGKKACLDCFALINSLKKIIE